MKASNQRMFDVPVTSIEIPDDSLANDIYDDLALFAYFVGFLLQLLVLTLCFVGYLSLISLLLEPFFGPPSYPNYYYRFYYSVYFRNAIQRFYQNDEHGDPQLPAVENV